MGSNGACKILRRSQSIYCIYSCSSDFAIQRCKSFFLKRSAERRRVGILEAQTGVATVLDSVSAPVCPPLRSPCPAIRSAAVASTPRPLFMSISYIRHGLPCMAQEDDHGDNGNRDGLNSDHK